MKLQHLSKSEFKFVIKVINVEKMDDLSNLDHLVSPEDKFIVFDLSRINLINSTFISFVNVNEQVIALLNPSPKVFLLLKLMGVDKLVPIIKHIDEAYALISVDQKNAC